MKLTCDTRTGGALARAALADTPSSGLRRAMRGRVSAAKMPLNLLLLRLLFAPAASTWLRRRWNDMRHSCVVHFFVQRGEFLLADFLYLCRGIIYQRRQLRKFFFLVRAGGRREAIEIIHEFLDLIGQRIRFPLERRTCIAKPFAFTDELLGDTVHLFLQ